MLPDRDPEEARKILDPVLEFMLEAVHRYEGTVNHVMGDGVMALFGGLLMAGIWPPDERDTAAASQDAGGEDVGACSA